MKTLFSSPPPCTWCWPPCLGWPIRHSLEFWQILRENVSTNKLGIRISLKLNYKKIMHLFGFIEYIYCSPKLCNSMLSCKLSKDRTCWILLTSPCPQLSTISGISEYTFSAWINSDDEWTMRIRTRGFILWKYILELKLNYYKNVTCLKANMLPLDLRTVGHSHLKFSHL